MSGDGPAPLLDRVVADDEAGTRLDSLLAAWLDEPRARAQDRLGAGEVRVGRSVAVKSRRVSAGDRVVVATPPDHEVPPAPALDVRWRDEHLAVVAKPAGLLVHAGAGAPPWRSGAKIEPTLVDALTAAGIPLAAGDDPVRPGIVHRLDRGTSGLLVVASTEAARQGLAALFARHDVDRRYWALVEGVPTPASATIDAPIARSTSHRTRFTVAPGGRHAVSHYDVVEPHRKTAVVDVRLETGRTHQVRVHLAAVGHKVAGDTLYAADAALSARLGLTRPALHARRLGFTHPVTREPIVCDDPLPPDLATALTTARTL